ncbi:GNAT family N-acetyltransferase [Xenorhabdus innexi]|uniref:N-acetyltransferase n=1 Tax=Xenorhabdus innexi TaxID=290109 RepID=A0A1N6MUY0_9GAMM|nr:GNAT family N-acetyltransferase [Xenorhabdus innexi]PHM31122.1 N-acetyltransferase [Xenorhabdus innexi]SIP72622.1 hypothetical protein XIS1_1580030 [Xenorhabdus innexi]
MKINTLFGNVLSRLHIGESSKEIYLKKFQTVIKEVSKSEMFIALAHIKVSILDWYSDSDLTMKMFAERQNSFVSVYQEMESLYQNPSNENSTKHHRYFICSVQSIPVGIMVFVPAFGSGADRIGFILTHPATHGCGSLLIEKAVELSNNEEIWTNAKPHAVRFYQNLGFEMSGFSDFETTSMRLIPSESPVWKFTDNQYRLKERF